MALIYATKPEAGATMTLARSGDTALVVDTSRADTSTSAGDPAPAQAPDVASAPGLGLSGGSGGSAAPGVGPADLEMLRGQGPVVPVAGVAAGDLVDSFDDMRGGTRRHNALDIMAARNTPVVASVTGNVLKLHTSVPGGLTIYMSDATSRFVMMYGHLESFRPGLKEGQAVKRGELIGFVGSSGNANPLAPHLHFQITRNDDLKSWWKGTPLNPFPVFRPKG